MTQDLSAFLPCPEQGIYVNRSGKDSTSSHLFGIGEEWGDQEMEDQRPQWVVSALCEILGFGEDSPLSLAQALIC